MSNESNREPRNVRRIGEECPFCRHLVTMFDGASTVCAGPMHHRLVNPDHPPSVGYERGQARPA